MKQCLRVLSSIQPASREKWRDACFEDLEFRGEACLSIDMDLAIKACVDQDFARRWDSVEGVTLYGLASELDDILPKVDALYERNRKLNAKDAGAVTEPIVHLETRDPVYVVYAPSSITDAERQNLLDMLKAMGCGFIVDEKIVIEEY